MKEHHKMKPSDNIPEGMEYKSEYWDSALDLIKRKEAQLLWYRILGLSAAVILIVGAVFWQVEQKSAVASLLHSTQPQIIASASPLDQLFSNSEKEVHAGIQLNQSSASIEPTHDLTSKRVVSRENHQATPIGIIPTENELGPHNTGNVKSFETITSDRDALETTPIHQATTEKNPVMTNIESPDHELTNPLLIETGLAQNQTPEFEGTEDPSRQKENIAKANYDEKKIANKETIAKANEEGEELARRENIAKASKSTEADQNLESEMPNLDSPAAAPAGSILENKASSRGNWKLVPTNLLSRKIQNIPQKYAVPGTPIIVGNLSSLAQSFPIPHYSIQLVLGNGFKTQYGSRINSASFQPVAGLAFDYNLNKKWSFNAEANYSQVNNVLRKIERTDRQLGYILRSQTTLLSTTKLHFMNLPVQLARRLGERHQVHAGLGLSYLLTTDNLIQVSSQTSFDSEQGEVQETQGYTQGWKTFSTFGSIGYSYYLKPSTSIRVSYQYGLTDMTDNAEFSHSVYDRNSQLNLTLHFNLIER